MENNITGQQRLEEHVKKTLYENNVVQKATINGLMEGREGGCSFDERTITFQFPVLEWQANRVGKMHGGAICTAFDLTIAALARFFAGENFAPTISLNVNYMRPIDVGDVLMVRAKAVQNGRRITQLTGEAFAGSTGKMVAIATSTYMNVDTVEEHKKPETAKKQCTGAE
ncbi:MAG: PaaI family thioesterase [Eubacteriales bacterium]|nr:PaaI family thioesterase [Eubacteriales bacterium]